MTLGNDGLSIFGDDHSGDNLLASQGTAGTTYFVDSAAANDNGSGTSWALAKKTIQAALDLCTGSNTIFVKRGAYQETLTTPINATAPFCQLIGVDPTDRGYGVYLYPTTGGDTILTLNARGWRVSGFEFESSTGEGIRLVRDSNGTNRSDYGWIDHCHFTFCKYDIRHVGGAYHIEIDHCEFDNSTAAIYGADSSFASPRNWSIHHNEFVENTNHIKFGASWGLNSSKIFKNILQGTGGSKSAKDGEMIDLRGGTTGVNIVSDNILGIDQAAYDAVDGPCLPGTNDFWVANYVIEGIMDENPAGG